GYWRIGGDNLSGWPNRPANNFLNGRIDEVAIYPKALTAEQISLRYVASGRESTSKPPTAAFDWPADDLAASFDASGSTDQGGSIENYAWDFGDGETGTGRTVEHEYAAPGGYDVTLTVTDDEGMTGKVTKRVTVTGPGVIASDTFGRTTSSGWGSADGGGDWTGTGAAFSTASGVGRINFGSAGAMLGTGLTQPVGRDVTMITDLAVDKVLTGNGLAVSLQARRNGDSDYRLKVRFLPNGETHLVLARAVNGAETVLHEVNVPSVTY